MTPRRVLLCGTDAVLHRMLAYELRSAGLSVVAECDEADCVLADLDTVSPTAIPHELPAIGYTRGGATPPAGMPCIPRPIDIPALVELITRLSPPEAPAAPTGLQLDDTAHTVICGRERLTLMPGEYAVLRCLLAADGEPVNRAELLAALPSGGDSSSNLTEVLICSLRRHLESAFGLRPIRTVRGIGYRIERDL